MFFFAKFVSTNYFYKFSGHCYPWLLAVSLSFLSLGLVIGLAFAPPDYIQGDVFRIIYVHVPSAVLSLSIYALMGLSAAISMIWRIKLADIVVTSSAPIGACFTFLALVTGSVWGYPTWGTWWIWDARLTSELILLFLYIAIIGLRSAITDREKASKASSILILVGIIDLPIIHYSVYWWNTLHQKATILKWQAPSIDHQMLWPLLSMLIGFVLFFVSVLIIRMRSEILLREFNSSWIRDFHSLPKLK